MSRQRRWLGKASSFLDLSDNDPSQARTSAIGDESTRQNALNEALPFVNVVGIYQLFQRDPEKAKRVLRTLGAASPREYLSYSHTVQNDTLGCMSTL